MIFPFFFLCKTVCLGLHNDIQLYSLEWSLVDDKYNVIKIMNHL